jgi:hypothetical protein
VQGDVVERVELSPKEVVQDDCDGRQDGSLIVSGMCTIRDAKPRSMWRASTDRWNCKEDTD